MYVVTETVAFPKSLPGTQEGNIMIKVGRRERQRRLNISEYNDLA